VIKKLFIYFLLLNFSTTFLFPESCFSFESGFSDKVPSTVEIRFIIDQVIDCYVDLDNDSECESSKSSSKKSKSEIEFSSYLDFTLTKKVYKSASFDLITTHIDPFNESLFLNFYADTPEKPPKA
jgi:hypothetical protein